MEQFIQSLDTTIKTIIFWVIALSTHFLFKSLIYRSKEKLFEILIIEDAQESNVFRISMIDKINTTMYHLSLGTSQRGESLYFNRHWRNAHIYKVNDLEEAKRIALIHYRLFHSPVGMSIKKIYSIPKYELKIVRNANNNIPNRDKLPS